MAMAQSTRSPKRTIILVSLAALILLAIGTCLNLWLGHIARQIVRDQFNEEQLVLARSIKYWVERQAAFLVQELCLAAEGLDSAVLLPADLYRTLKPSLQRVMEIGVSKISVSDPEHRIIYDIYPHGFQKTAGGESAADAMQIQNHSGDPSVSISLPRIDGSEIYQDISLALTHPVFDRLSFQINLSWFLGPLLKNIRSGKTGYAWMIDAQGRFLYHPQQEFIGLSAFEARQSREPGISHHLIHTIQREKMLTGQEGTGTYVSTWHRGLTGKIEKLIAYCPVIVSAAPAQTWSVAVVAPVSEIENAVGRIHRWIVVLQGLFMIVIMAAASSVLWFEFRWSRRLEKTVQVRTTALKRSEENYRSLVESAEDFIFTLDREGKLISVNNFTAAFFGSRPEDLIGQSVGRLFSEDIAARQIKNAQTVFEKGKSIRDEFELKMGDAQIWISANFMSLKDATGKLYAVLCIARDISENKRLERFLINSEKLASLGTLAAGVAHEINNPLGVMLGFCDLLVRTKQPGSQEYEDLKTIERQGLHCKQIVENLLSFARTGREATSDADLNQCILEIIKVVRHSLQMKTIDLLTDLAPDLPRIVGDDRQLQQVFLNLINNAAAAMPGGGLLEIRTSLSGGGKKVIAQFQDQGSGIAPEHLDHIFEPFFTTKPEGEGTGLGLFVSYGIIQKFGGRITCESHTQDSGNRFKGTIFTVELPLFKEETKWRAEF